MDEAFLKALLEKFARLNAWLRDERKARLFFTLLIPGLALLYYGSYFRHDLRFRDEGGTIALGAQRLLNGERPLVDVTLNYNVLWFYPVVALFKWFGVNFVLMRAWFLALSAVAALLAFLAVKRAGRQPWIAFAVALLCVLVPGMIFKNYIPLLVVANSSLLMRAALTAPRTTRSFFHVAGGGIADPGRQREASRHYRHRAYAVGHAWCAGRAQRAPPLQPRPRRNRGQSARPRGIGPQRHH